jgi:carbohydrate-selective porin OprB
MESVGNPTGGDLHKLRYTHDLGLAIYLDLDKLLGLKHTYFLATASQRVGNNLSGGAPNSFIGHHRSAPPKNPTRRAPRSLRLRHWPAQ